VTDDQRPAPRARDATVVVATFRRPGLLAAQLDALSVQRTDLEYEIVVVDDASGDDTEAFLRQRSATDPRIRVVTMARNGGPARARNAGIDAATGTVIAFTDDDCVAEPGWLEAIVRPILDDRADVVQGRTLAEPFGQRDHWSHSISVAGPNRFETCNMAYRADLLARLGGFDGSFRNAEDAELGNRALEHGARFSFVPEAVVQHARIRLDLATMLRRRRLATALARVARAHPSFREQLWRGVFWRRGHVRVLAGAAGTAVALATRRPLLAAALVVLWSAREGRPYSDARPLRRLGLGAGIVAADIVEVSATLEGAVRERTLLL
jgi:GT2 family glycosyltransferase